MDEPVIGFIRDRFNKVDADNGEMLACLKEHIKKDEAYWKKIDEQHAQIRLVKWLGGTGVAGTIAHWLYQRFGH